MAQIKYYYDTATCNYEKIKTSKGDVFFNLLGFLTVSMIMAMGIFWGYTTYFESPKEIKLQQENATLRLYYDTLQKEVENHNQVLAYLQEQDDKIYRTIFEAEPIPASVRKAGIGGIERYKDLENKPLIASTLQKVDQFKRELYIQSQSYSELLNLAQKKEKMLAAIPAIQPISNQELKRLAAGFGMRLHPIYKVNKMHEGVDFSAPRGTPIYATGDGIISLTNKSYQGYGNRVEIDHGYGFVTRYCHMQSFHVKPKQRVKRGQCIGYVGSTGVSTAPHLHYEVIKNRKKVDPAHYFFNDLNAAQYQKLLALASRKTQSLS